MIAKGRCIAAPFIDVQIVVPYIGVNPVGFPFSSFAGMEDPQCQEAFFTQCDQAIETALIFQHKTMADVLETHSILEYCGPTGDNSKSFLPKQNTDEHGFSYNFSPVPASNSPTYLKQLLEIFSRVKEIAYANRDVLTLDAWIAIIGLIAIGVAASGPSVGTSLGGALAGIIAILILYMDQFPPDDQEFLRGISSLAANVKIDENGSLALDNLQIHMMKNENNQPELYFEKIDPLKQGLYDGLAGTQIKKADSDEWALTSQGNCQKFDVEGNLKSKTGC